MWTADAERDEPVPMWTADAERYEPVHQALIAPE